MYAALYKCGPADNVYMYIYYLTIYTRFINALVTVKVLNVFIIQQNLVTGCPRKHSLISKCKI